MTLRHIRIFLEVCEQDCHVTRAAEALHMTQPAVTLAIQEMEGYYGVKLFERIGRRLRITEAGVRLRESGGHIIELFDRMEKALLEMGLGNQLPRSSEIIRREILPAVAENPAFYFLKEDPRYLNIIKRIKTALEKEAYGE